MTAPRPVPTLYAALDTCTDEELQALIARAQALLLDRPVSPESTAPLAVEIVGQEERRLLIFYRALSPLARGRVLRYMRLCYGRARGAWQQHRGSCLLLTYNCRT